MICKHNFIKLTEIDKRETSPIPAGLNQRKTPGAVVGCAKCGQVRNIWADGTVEIVHEGTKPIDEDDHGNK